MPKIILYIVAIVLIGVFLLYQTLKGKKIKKGQSELPGIEQPDTEIGEVGSPARKTNILSRIFRSKKSAQSSKSGESEGDNKAKGEEVGGDKKDKPKYASVEAYVYNDMTGRCCKWTLTGEEVGMVMDRFGTLGRPRLEEDGKYRYQLNHDNKGYRPTFYPYSAANSAAKLYRAQSHPEVPLIYDLEKAKGLLEKYGLYLLFAGAVLFAMWTILAK